MVHNVCSWGLGYDDISLFAYIVWEDSTPLPADVLTKSECENMGNYWKINYLTNKEA